MWDRTPCRRDGRSLPRGVRLRSTATGHRIRLWPTVAAAYAIRIHKPAEPWGRCRDRGHKRRARVRGGGGGGSGASWRPVTSTELYKFRKWFDGNSAFASRTACQCCEIARNAAVWHATCHVTRSPEVKMHAPHATVYVRCHAPRHPLLPCLGAAQPQPHPLGRHTARSGTTRCDSLRAGAAWRARSCRAGYHAGWDRAPA